VKSTKQLISSTDGGGGGESPRAALSKGRNLGGWKKKKRSYQSNFYFIKALFS